MKKKTARIFGKVTPNIRVEMRFTAVFQESMLFSDTIENNIRMGNQSASFEQVVEAAKNANIHDVIMRLRT